MADQTTMIGIRDFTTGQRAFRHPASELGTFDDLTHRTYAGFHRDAHRFRLHFHFQQNTPCTSIQLLSKQEWDDGEYFIGGRIEFFAHFVGRQSAVARAGIHDRASNGGRRASVAGLTSPPLPSRAQRTATPLQSAAGYLETPSMMGSRHFSDPRSQGWPPNHPSLTPSPYAFPPLGTAPHNYNAIQPPLEPPLPRLRHDDPEGPMIERRPTSGSRQRRANNAPIGIAQQRPRQRLNSTSTTVYSRTTTAMSAQPFPGFQPSRVSLQSSANSVLRQKYPAPQLEPPLDLPDQAVHSDPSPARSSDSMEILPSPVYNINREVPPAEPQQQQLIPSRCSASQSSVESNGLFVTEPSDIPDMEALGWVEEE
ncbi:Nn.00g029600.m01.CDS01 [Neocucurbitaria sp. VM-36]